MRESYKQYLASKLYTMAWSYSQERWVVWESGNDWLQLYTLEEAQVHCDGWNKKNLQPSEGCNFID